MTPQSSLFAKPQNTILFAGYKFTDSNEVAVQQVFKSTGCPIGKLTFGYRHRFNRNLESKLRIDHSGLLGVSTNYNLHSGVNIGANIETGVCSKAKFSGFLGQAINFGLKITHNN
jgi:hypothetical protein